MNEPKSLQVVVEVVEVVEVEVVEVEVVEVEVVEVTGTEVEAEVSTVGTADVESVTRKVEQGDAPEIEQVEDILLLDS